MQNLLNPITHPSESSRFSGASDVGIEIKKTRGQRHSSQKISAVKCCSFSASSQTDQKSVPSGASVVLDAPGSHKQDATKTTKHKTKEKNRIAKQVCKDNAVSG